MDSSIKTACIFAQVFHDPDEGNADSSTIYGHVLLPIAAANEGDCRPHRQCGRHCFQYARCRIDSFVSLFDFLNLFMHSYDDIFLYFLAFAFWFTAIKIHFWSTFTLILSRSTPCVRGIFGYWLRRRWVICTIHSDFSLCFAHNSTQCFHGHSWLQSSCIFPF